MQVNPFNSVVALGHLNGTVTMWKPTSPTPLVKMLANHGPVSALAFHSNGHLMATTGMDRKIKLWDLRKFEVLQTLPGHVSQADSFRGAANQFLPVWRSNSTKFKPAIAR
ncbi:U3 small nucleolar RNA-associated protein 7-like [Camellia sinensis]|uniref:U3 small nucleolar RNA-associated protein 7-like n=1 Tax=Camellia sinensis TaxID=4442 RepID=UPI001036C608|nr:U3 small nucleolar RNA-associated protein 7-like [Camellia sinensis]